MSNKTLYAFSLSISCVFDNRIEFCPFTETKRLSAIDRYKHIMSLDNSEINKLVKHHENCRKNDGHCKGE